MSVSVKKTIEFAKLAHKNQVDKGGFEYWLHPITVSNLLPEWSSEDEVKAAILHDVVEDTPYSLKDLKTAGFSDVTTGIVEMVSRDKSTGQTYKEWVQSIADSKNLGAIRVKLADNIHNSSLDRMKSLPKNQRGIWRRYYKMRKILFETLKEISLDDYFYFIDLCNNLNIRIDNIVED